MVELYFYKGLRYGGLLSKLICLFSIGRFSHVEIYFPAYNKRYSALPETGTFCSIGCVEEPHKWEVIRISCTGYQQKILNRCLGRQINMPYDYRGVFGCLFKYIKQDPSKYFCSEYILTSLDWVKLYDGEVIISPSKMYKNLIKIDKETVDTE